MFGIVIGSLQNNWNVLQIVTKWGAEGELLWHVPGPFMVVRRRVRVSFKDYHRWWDTQRRPEKYSQCEEYACCCLTSTELCNVSVFRKDNCKPALLRWHLMTSAGRCAVRTAWKVEFGGLFLYHDDAPAHTPLSMLVWISGLNNLLYSEPCQIVEFNALWLISKPRWLYKGQEM